MARIKADKNRVHTSRELEDHVVAQATIDKVAGVDPQYEVTKGEVHSSTNLEDDTGTGKAVMLKFFEFGANPEAFKARIPTGQELFNAHRHQIEYILSQEDLEIYEGFPPKISISKNKKSYRIVVAGLPWGLSRTKIKTLSEIANDS